MHVEETTKTASRRIRRVLVCLLCFLLGGALTVTATWVLLGQDGRTLVKAYRLIQENFVGEYDTQETMDATLEAMVNSLGDRWSYYLDPAEAQAVREQRNNAYVGIGVTVNQAGEEDGLTIRMVTPDSPAQEGGLTAGEIIRAVDGQEVTPENREDLINAIKGEEGTTVILEVEGLDGTRRTVTLERRQVHNVNASWTMLEDQVGLVTIQNFYSGTAALVEQGVAELQAQGARALVFDVRNNVGGYVSELTDLLDYLLPEGKIFVERTADGQEIVYTSEADCVDLPMAVVVNADSYSAAEFFAAQLRESVGAAVVGEQTSGKGYSQLLYALPNGSAMGLSSARYYTGGGVSLIGTGLNPEPELSLSQEEAEGLLLGTLDPQEDLQLQAAIQALPARE